MFSAYVLLCAVVKLIKLIFVIEMYKFMKVLYLK